MPATVTSTKTKNVKRFVTIPRKEYEELLSLKRTIPFFKPTKAELRALALAREDFKKGNYISWQTLKHELANRRSKPGKKTT